MVEYLITLKAVTVTPTALASTGLVRALGAIEDKHETKPVRELARFVRISVCMASDQKLAPKCRASDDREKKKRANDAPPCRTCIVSSIRVGGPAREVSTPLSKMKLPTKRAPVVDARRANTAASIDKSSKPPAAARNGRSDRAVIDKQMMESAKRKLREGYEQAADDAKRQRRIPVIDAPKMPEQRRREMTHPVLMETSRGSRGGASNTAVRRSSMMHAR
jgi:hypothetical protein